MAIRTPAQEARRMDLVSGGLLDVPGAVEFTRLSRSTIFELLRAGTIASVRVGKSRRIPRRALEEFVAANLVDVDTVGRLTTT